MQESEGLLEKNSEAVLKAARLGDLAMLAELHKDGYSLLAIDETAKVTDSTHRLTQILLYSCFIIKTALHYGARFGNKEIVKFLLQKAPHSILDIVGKNCKKSRLAPGTKTVIVGVRQREGADGTAQGCRLPSPGGGSEQTGRAERRDSQYRQRAF